MALWLCARSRTIKRYIATVNEELEISEEYACGARVTTCFSMTLKSWYATLDNDDDKLTVSGQLEISVIYSSRRRSATKNINFAFCAGTLLPEAKICALAYRQILRSSRLIIEGSENDNTFKMIICISLQGFVINKKTSAIVDLYSPTNALEVGSREVRFDKQNGVMRFEEE